MYSGHYTEGYLDRVIKSHGSWSYVSAQASGTILMHTVASVDRRRRGVERERDGDGTIRQVMSRPTRNATLAQLMPRFREEGTWIAARASSPSFLETKVKRNHRRGEFVIAPPGACNSARSIFQL